VLSALDHGVKGGHFGRPLLPACALHRRQGIRGNHTIDQRAAETIGGITRFPSLTVGSEDGPARRLHDELDAQRHPFPPIQGPRSCPQAFTDEQRRDRDSAKDRLRLQGSILDRARRRIRSRQLDTSDRQKLDEYSFVRDARKALNWWALGRDSEAEARMRSLSIGTRQRHSRPLRSDDWRYRAIPRASRRLRSRADRSVCGWRAARLLYAVRIMAGQDNIDLLKLESIRRASRRSDQGERSNPPAISTSRCAWNRSVAPVRSDRRGRMSLTSPRSTGSPYRASASESRPAPTQFNAFSTSRTK